MTDKSDVERITSALLRLHKANALERRIYLCMSVTSFVALMVVSIHAYLNSEIDPIALTSMFAATGVIGVCITRILSIWRDCLSILRVVIEKQGASS